MIDDELLQELLAKASGLYNNGDYHGAISVWKEALAADPSSQKAREGIQMATLLLGDWDPAAESADGPQPAAAADGAPASQPRLTPDERAARLDEGVARVRTLLQQRQYSAAIEGARSLVPIDPDSDEVQRLVDEAQQAFEAAPFIEEHLTLARELAAQERLSEAEVQCRKVFALDPANPDALALAAALRARMAAPEGASGAGGVTMKMEIADLMAAQERVAAPDEPGAEDGLAPVEDPAAGADADAAIAASLPDDLMDLDLGTPGDPAAESIEATASPEPASGLMPEPMFDPEPEPALETAPDQDGFEIESLVPGTPGTEPAAEEIVDAETVVPPTVRLVPRTGTESDSIEAFLEKTEDVVSVPMASPASAAPASPAAAPAASIGWEEELESLNLKTGEHDIVGRSASLSATPATPSGSEMDLSSLLGDDNDELSGPAQAAPPPSAAGPPPAPQPHDESPLDDLASGLADEMIGGDQEITDAAADVSGDAPEPEPRTVPAAPPRQRPRLSVPPMLFAVLGVVILTGAGAIWWFVYQPKTAAAHASAPPSGAPPADHAPGDSGGGPIPTPLGSSSRQPAQVAGNASAVAGVAAAPQAADTGSEATPGAAADTGTTTEATPAPAPPRPSPEQLRQEATRHLADGRRLMAARKWQEARAELAAALALDPVNFECKEMLDQVQAKVDEEVKVTRDLDEARRAFADKDYQGCLWKLYRLPKDPRLGDIDMFIRNAWFNWSVVGLKGGDATDARQKLSEVLTVDPDDADAKKMLAVAEGYSSRAKDRVFYSFTDSLRFRAFDQK